MATPKQFTFAFKELAEVLVREAGVREGNWGLYVRFGLSATNVGTSDDDLKPAAIVPIVELGIQQFDTPNSLTVDAADVQRKQVSEAQKATAHHAV